MDGAATAGATAATYTGKAASALASVSISVGERVAGLFGAGSGGEHATSPSQGRNARESAEDARIRLEGEEENWSSSNDPGAWKRTKNAAGSAAAGISDG